MSEITVTLLAALGPTLLLGVYGIARFVAGRWSLRVEQGMKLRTDMEAREMEIKDELKSVLSELSEEKMKGLFCEQRMTWCERQLERLDRGRERSLD